jgi:hypothetical protein
MRRVQNQKETKVVNVSSSPRSLVAEVVRPVTSIDVERQARTRAMRIDAEVKRRGFARPGNKLNMGAIFHLEHWRKDQLLAERHEENLCPDEFINYMLDAGLSGGTPITAWDVLLFNDNHTPSSTDTYATPVFTESTAYDESTRPAWTEAGVSSKVITNSASKATFTMTGVDTSIYGAALVGGGTGASTKDDQAGGGTLGPEAQFTGGAVTGIVDDDVLKVYITITGSDV